MGFEQLAELKEKLAKRAEAKPVRAEAKPVRTGVKPAAKAPRARRPAPSGDSKPVDPVVITIGKLQKKFPRAFPKNPAPKVPLKVGIFEDLLIQATELGLAAPELRDAIKTWCRGSRYWTCLAEGAARVDLSGGEAGRVSPQDAVRAKSLEAGRLARAAAKPAKPENPPKQ
jgi:ProP effector